MATIDLLRDARRRLSKRGAWTRGEVARTRSGAPVIPNGESAVSWCALGALDASNPSFHVRHQARGLLVRAMGGVLVSDFNDTAGRKKREVLAAFDKAIALACARAKGRKR
jgi:hypothetical protein